MIELQRQKDKQLQEKKSMMDMVSKYILKFYRDKYKDIRLKVEKVFDQYINFEGGENEKNVSASLLSYFNCIVNLMEQI